MPQKGCEGRFSHVMVLAFLSEMPENQIIEFSSFCCLKTCHVFYSKWLNKFSIAYRLEIFEIRYFKYHMATIS